MLAHSESFLKGRKVMASQVLDKNRTNCIQRQFCLETFNQSYLNNIQILDTESLFKGNFICILFSRKSRPKPRK